MTVTIVVARYKENLDWLKPLATSCKFIVYNKGEDDVDPFFKHVIKLPNVGREGHSYIHHIITNNTKLDDVTVFTQGDIMDHKDQGYTPLEYLQLCIDTARSHPTGVSQNAHSIEYNISLYWFNVCNCNDSQTVGPYEAGLPLGRWLEDCSGKKQSCTQTRWHHGGIFAATRKALLGVPKDRWIAFLETLSYHINPATGHYLERSWYSILTRVFNQQMIL